MVKKTLYLLLKLIFLILLMVCTLAIEFFTYYRSYYDNKNISKAEVENIIQNQSKDSKIELPGETIQIITEIDDWRLVLVNSENTLPEDFEVELANFDANRKFDARAIGELIRND